VAILATLLGPGDDTGRIDADTDQCPPRPQEPVIPAPRRAPSRFSFEGGLPFDSTIEHLRPPPGLTDEARLAARRELTLTQIKCGVVLNPILLPTAQ
jgi:hypothetical protein